MPIRSKIALAKVKAADWQNPGEALRGLLEGKDIATGITLIRYVTDVVGEGPTLHVHPYDEVFTITEGRARFTVGDEVIDAEKGDIILGPANIPHGYQNLGPGRLDSLDIHLSPEWIQYNLADGWEGTSSLVSSQSKVKVDQSTEAVGGRKPSPDCSPLHPFQLTTVGQKGSMAPV
ncbi:MAG: mannose-6-phosphate isomerase-like protein (cupin superfamily) [Alphaproteobacteria bacterium]|jgi:mannose-6-phosphate isomerase-like protein (cupin superfamily)